MFNDSFNKALATAYYKGNFLEIADSYRRLKAGKEIKKSQEDFYEREHRCFKYVPKLIEQMIKRQVCDPTNFDPCPEVCKDEDDDAEVEKKDDDDEVDKKEDDDEENKDDNDYEKKNEDNDDEEKKYEDSRVKIADNPEDENVAEKKKKQGRKKTKNRDVIVFRPPDKCDCLSIAHKYFPTAQQQPFKCAEPRCFSSQRENRYSNMAFTPQECHGMVQSPQSNHNRNILKIHHGESRNCDEINPWIQYNNSCNHQPLLF